MVESGPAVVVGIEVEEEERERLRRRAAWCGVLLLIYVGTDDEMDGMWKAQNRRGTYEEMDSP